MPTTTKATDPASSSKPTPDENTPDEKAATDEATGRGGVLVDPPALEEGQGRRENLPGDNPHDVKVGTDDQGADVFAHHDAHGARFAI